ncbi:MAG: hypothetical protein IAE78_01905 [Myxococcus sp.]|nr:hypothetical protein [Myxococcus sp.]
MFCILCGARLVRRAEADIREELSRVEWLLEELPRWDTTLVSRADQRRLTQHYLQQSQWLLAELGVGSAPGPAVDPEVLGDSAGSLGTGAAADPVFVDLTEPAAKPPPQAEPSTSVSEVAAEPASASTRSAHPLEARDAPTLDEQVVREASPWSRVWKPFLTDSVGWFVGGFLILAGVYSLVTDAWADMTSLVRAVTVFGLAAGWTLAFFAWAKFLLRREVTAPAGRMLERLSAAMAPVATVAVGPLRESPALFWPLVLGWALVSAWLAYRPARHLDPAGAAPLAGAFGLAALMMGTAPLVSPLGVHAVWLTALPVGLAAWAFAAGPRAQPEASRFLLAAFGWAVALFVVRLEVALLQAGVPPTITLLAPMLAAGVASVRWLATPPTRAADARAVLVVVAQGGLLVASIDLFTPKPAFVVTALLGAWTALSLARERVTPSSARWLPVAYAFAYLAYQRIDQLVPQVVRDAYGQLKARLGYSTAPLPPSYGSVYAALFVVGVGLLALRWARSAHRPTRREGDVLLDTTAVASTLSSLLAIVSLPTDARPALVATPLLAVVTLGLALFSGRFALTLAGVVAASCAAVALSVGLHTPVWMGVGALLLAGASLPASSRHRLTLSAGSGLLALPGLVVALVAEPSAGATVTMALSSLALLLVARNLDLSEVLDLAWAGPLLTLVVASRWLTPGLGPLVLGAAAAGLGAVTLVGGRWKSLRLATVVAALSAVAWHLLVPTAVLWPGVTMLLSALALVLTSRASEGGASLALETAASTMALATLLPLGSFPWPSALVPQALAGLVALGASVHSVVRGRGFRLAWLAGGAVVMALTCCVGLTPEGLAVALGIALAATPALTPLVTVPLASLLLALLCALHLPASALPVAFSAQAVGLAALGVLDRVSSVRRVLLNGQRVGWPAVVMSALCLAPALGLEPSLRWLPMLVALVAPVLWAWSVERRGARLFATWLVALAALWSPPAWLVVAPLVAVGVAFSLRSSSGARDLILDRLVVWVTGACALCAGAVALGLGAPWFVVAAWSVALLLLPVGALAARLVLGAVVLAMTPAAPVLLVGVAAFFAVGFSLRHAPAFTAQLLGSRSVEWAQACAAFSGVGLAVTLVLREPSALTQSVLVGSLAATGLLLGVSALASVAMVAAAVDLPALIERGAMRLNGGSVWLAVGAAALAVVLRRGFVLEQVEERWERVGAPGRWLDRALWLGAALLVALHLPTGGALVWLAPALLLLVTPKVEETVAAGALVAFTLVGAAPLVTASVPIAALGAGLAWFGALRDTDAAKARLHTGWLLATASLGCSAALHAWAMPVCWALAAVTLWAVVKAYPAMRWAGWALTWAASHAALAYAGVALATGAPEALILPWFALASALVAVRPSTTPWVRQHVGVGFALRGVVIAELAAGMLLCPGGHPRDVLGVVIAVGVSLWLGWRDAREDEPAGVWLGALALSCGAVLARVLFSAQEQSRNRPTRNFG